MTKKTIAVFFGGRSPEHDVSVVSAGLVRVLGNLVKDVLTVIFTIGTMLVLNWQLSVFIVVFGLALWPIIEISKRLRGNARDVQEHIGRMTAELKESLGAAQLVKTLSTNWMSSM